MAKKKFTKENEVKIRQLKIQKALYAIADAASAVKDMQSFYKKLHRIVGKLMYAENFFIALYHPQTDWITWPYNVDTVDVEPQPPAKLSNFRGATGWVLRHGKTIAVVDGSWAGAISRGELQPVGTDSNGIAVPLRVGSKTIGVLMVQSYIEGIGYQRDDVKVLEFVAQHISTALTRARAIEETRQRNSELQIINSIQQGLAAELEFQAIIDLVGDKLREVFATPDLNINWYDEKTNLIHYHYEYKHGKRLTISPRPPQPGGIFETMARTRQPIILKNVADYKKLNAELLPGTKQGKSFVSVPVASSDRVLGTINIENFERENAFGESEVRLLTTVAASLGTALENARLFDETQQRNAELAIINAVQSALAAELGIQAIYDAVGEKLREIFEVQTVAIYAANLKSNVMHLEYAIEKGQKFPPMDAPLNSLYRHVLNLDATFVRNGDFPELAAKYNDYKVPGGKMPKSVLVTPVIKKKESDHVVSIGLLDIDSGRIFSDTDIRLVETVAKAMSVALKNARLFDEVQKKNAEISESLERETASNNILRVIAESPTDIQPVLDVIARNAAQLSGSDDAIITLRDGDMLRVDAHYGGIPTFPVGEGIRFNRDSVAGRAILEGCSLQAIHNLPGAKSEYREGDKVAKKYGYRMTCAVPLMRKGVAIGAISICRTKPELLTDKQIALIQSFASQAAIAVENVRLFHETARLLRETEEHNAELAIINSVQEGLSKKLDFKEIVDLVGEKVGVIFKADTVSVGIYDSERDWTFNIYYADRGERISLQDGPVARPSLTALLIDSRRSLLTGTKAEREKLGSLELPREGETVDKNETFMGVPILAGEKVIGVVSVQSYKQNAFDADNMRLLQTLVHTMSIALENARLFDETHRLLNETEQRAAELAIINSVQQGLASKLEMQSIYDLVGEKIRNIFQVEVVYIAIRNPRDIDQVDFPYYVDRGKILKARPLTLGEGLTSKVIMNRQPLLIGTFDEQIKLGAVLESDERANTYLGIPIIIGNFVAGVVSVQSYKENAFNDSDIRLLTTLASSMGVALENARLFDETQRLLKETEQRNAELAIINSVQEGLAAQLDIQAIYHLIGDKIRDTFDVQTVTINSFDFERNQKIYHYNIENGQHYPVGSRPMNSFDQFFFNSGRPYLLTKNLVEVTKSRFPDVVPYEGDLPKSFLAAPLTRDQKVFGYISLQNMEAEEAFGDSDVRLLSTLASSMSVALENARLFDETQRLLKETEERNAELAIINSVQEGLASKLEMRAIYNLVGDKVREIFDADTTYIGTYHPDEQVVISQYYVERDLQLTFPPFPMGRGLYTPVIQLRQPLLIGTIREQQEYGAISIPSPDSDEDLNETYLGVPILVGNEVKGIVSVQSYKQNAYNNNDVRLLQTLANSMSIALENARLFDETQRLLKETEQRAGELSAISTVSQALVAETELDSMIQLIGSQMREIFAADIVYVALLDKQTNLIHFPYQIGESFGTLNLGEGLTSKIIQTGMPLLLNKNIQERRAQLGTTLVGRESLSYLGVPIKSGKGTIGVLSVQSTTEEGLFDDDDMRLLTTIAANAGAAIHTAQLHAETQRRAREMAILAEIGSDIAASRELEPVLERIASHAKDILRVRDIAIYLRDGDELYVPVALGTYTEELKAQTLKIGKGITGNVAQIGAAEMINYPASDPRVVHVAGTPEDDDAHEAMMVAPLSSRGEVIGALTVWRPHSAGLFIQPDLDFLISVARQTAIAIESARLYLETQRRAREMSALVDVGREISASLDAETVLASIATHAKDLLNGDLSALFLPEGDGSTFRAITAVGDEAEELRNDTINLGEGILGNIAKNRVGEIVNDVNNDSRALTITGTRLSPDEHMIVVPLLANEELKGLMSVWRHGKGKEFIHAELEFLNGLSRQAVIAVQNAQLFAETTETLEQQTATSEILQAIANSPTDIQPVLEVIAQNAARLSGSDDALIDIKDNEILRVVAHFGSIPMFPVGEGIPLNQESVAGRAIVQGRTLQTLHKSPDEESEYPEGDKWAQKYAYRITCSVPLLREGKAIGAITIRRLEPDLLNNKQVSLIETFASQAVIAIENVRLFNELQTRNREITEALEQQTATSEILRVIAGSPTEIQPVLEAVAQNAARLCEANDVQIYKVDGDLLRQVTHYGPIPALQDGEALPLVPSLITGRAVIEHRTIHIEDVQQLNKSEYPESIALQKRLGHRTVLVTPLLREGNAIGAIVVRRNAVRPFSQKQSSLLGTFADQAAIAIENVRLFNETQHLLKVTEQRAAELAILNSVGESMTRTLDVKKVTYNVGDKIREIFAAEIVDILHYDPANRIIQLVYSYCDGRYYEDEPPWELGTGLTSKIILSRQPILLNSAQAMENHGAAAYVTTPVDAQDPESYMGVPIMVGDRIMGVVDVQNYRPNAFNEDNLRLLQTLSANMGVALENARLFTEIESQRQYLEAIISNSPVAIITADLNGKVVSWNPAAETLFGYTRAEALGKDTNDLIALADEIRAEALICSIQTRKGELFHSITRRNRKDGIMVEVDMAVVPVSVGKERMGIVGIYHDITELQRARQEAIAANEAKSSFLATMSHEIRTPMNAVIGMSGLLLDTKLDKEQRDYAETIRNSSDALLAIINDILDFSKIEAGKMDLEQQPFDLRECVESALDLVAARAVEKNIDLAYLIEDGVPAGIYGDVTRLRQILLNLLSNAVKFTEQGEVVLTVAGSKSGKNDLLFTVRDTGIGIPRDRIGQLFESFSQVDSSTTRKFGGTGLGLAISKRLAEMMDGSMRVESEGRDKGSTFSFTIRAKPAKVTRRKERNLEDVWPALEGKRVLIVDDNKTNRRILVLQTRKWGLRARETKSARQALRWLKQGELFDLAIFDLQMPEMDGIMLTSEARKLTGAKSMPIILLTSLGRREAGVKDMDIAAYLTKPLKPSALFDALAVIFTQQKVTLPHADSAKPALDPGMAKQHPLRILLAEDNQVNQKLALRLLQQMGYRADVASNGLEAVESVRRQPYDVILMDVQMPEMDGLDATRTIRKADIKQPYIIAMTANAMQGDRELCLAAGMEFYITKPIRVPELVAALKLVKKDGR